MPAATSQGLVSAPKTTSAQPAAAWHSSRAPETSRRTVAKVLTASAKVSSAAGPSICSASADG